MQSASTVLESSYLGSLWWFRSSTKCFAINIS